MDDPLGYEDEAYRTCAECGGDCGPEPMPTDADMRIAFSCPTHGVRSAITGILHAFDGHFPLSNLGVSVP